MDNLKLNADDPLEQRDIKTKRWEVEIKLDVRDVETGRTELSVGPFWGDLPFDAKHFLIEASSQALNDLARRLQASAIQVAGQRGFPRERLQALLAAIEAYQGGNATPPQLPNPTGPGNSDRK